MSGKKSCLALCDPVSTMTSAIHLDFYDLIVQLNHNLIPADWPIHMMLQKEYLSDTRYITVLTRYIAYYDGMMSEHVRVLLGTINAASQQN